MKSNRKHRKPAYITAILLTAVLSVLGCGGPAGLTGTDDFNVEMSASSITVKNTPAVFDTATLTVSGEGMDAITENITPDQNSITLEVPSGEARTFELSMSNETSSFSGSTTVDLTAGEETEVPLQLDLSDLKIVIPNRTSQENGLVQIDDLSGSGWRTIYESELPLGQDELLYLEDIDYDQFGRIYTIINNTQTEKGAIVRFDSFGAFDEDFIIPAPTTSGIETLVVDRKNSLIYFAYDYGGSLAKADYSGQIVKEYTSFDFTPAIQGMAVDDNGMLHLGFDTLGDGYSLNEFDPSGNGTLSTTAQNGALWGIFDVTFRNGSLFVTGYDSDSENLVGKFPQNYSSSSTPGTLYAGPQNGQDTFRAPQIFLPSVSDTIYVIDDTGDSGVYARIVGFSDINGTGWTTFMGEDIGKENFDFIYPLG